MSFLIFDIETIPDLSLWTPPVAPPPPDPAAPLPSQAGLPGVAPTLQSVPQQSTMTLPANPAAGFTMQIPPAGQRKARKPRATKPKANGEPAKEPFAPLYAHRVIAIGWVWLELDAGVAEVRGLGAVGTSRFGDDEAALLTGWNDFVFREQPTVVTFNGRGFDVPVLSLRALRLGVSQSWSDKKYRHRYGDEHMDLFDLLTEHGVVPRAGMSLDTFSEIIGLPGKNGVDGSKVREMFQRGEIAKIEQYAVADTVRTAFVLLRYLLMIGRLGKEQYQRAARLLLEHATAAQLQSIVFGIDSKRLLLE